MVVEIECHVTKINTDKFQQFVKIVQRYSISSLLVKIQLLDCGIFMDTDNGFLKLAHTT